MEKAPAMLALLHLNSSRIATKKIGKERFRPYEAARLMKEIPTIINPR
jgi:hypothetical protein